MSTSSRTLQTFTQQETVRLCLLFILQLIYLHNRTRLHRESHHAFTNGYSIYWPIAHQCFWIFNWLTLPHLTLKMASAQVVETSVTNNSPSQDSYHPDDLFQSRYQYSWVQTISLYTIIYKHGKRTRQLKIEMELKNFSARNNCGRRKIASHPSWMIAFLTITSYPTSASGIIIRFKDTASDCKY